ncbi:hypothetical protein CFC21_068511 [Triticum aestivum]|uniref:Serpin domain-containing protein n=2 Tax=Triticum aestivum TaxID=4565 RepID=A0A9R1HBH9_WHEAT|nr:hypothetical protein CFC21_068508 [Triticum aestivum]KAF7061847.1 hypothetical protein CFC21_068511 [Triticum aestivum]
MSPFGKFLFCLTLLAAWRLSSTLFTEAPPAPGVDPAFRNASCLALAREAGVRAEGGTGSNFVISPLSIHAAFAKVAAGARGDTLNELLRFLGSASLNELHRAAATELVGRLNGIAQTSFASGVWVDRMLALKPEFTAIAASRYNATVESVDFVSGAEQARQRVNAFVADATNKQILQVLPPGSVNSGTAVVLANALYFKGAWTQPFDVSTAPFHIPGGTTVRVPSMTTSESQQIAVYPGFRALKLPYKNDAVSTPEFIKTHTPTKKVPVGQFMVPKFKFTSEFEVSSAMRKLGVTRAFQGGDFSSMMTGGEGISITGVYHKATIEVDEVGTVAAAATAVLYFGSAAPGAPRDLVDFVADRPFLFAMVEEGIDAVLFLGHLANPLAH